MQEKAAQSVFSLSLNEGQYQGKTILDPRSCQILPSCGSPLLPYYSTHKMNGTY